MIGAQHEPGKDFEGREIGLGEDESGPRPITVPQPDGDEPISFEDVFNNKPSEDALLIVNTAEQSEAEEQAYEALESGIQHLAEVHNRILSKRTATEQEGISMMTYSDLKIEDILEINEILAEMRSKMKKSSNLQHFIEFITMLKIEAKIQSWEKVDLNQLGSSEEFYDFIQVLRSIIIAGNQELASRDQVPVSSRNRLINVEEIKAQQSVLHEYLRGLKFELGLAKDALDQTNSTDTKEIELILGDLRNFLDVFLSMHEDAFKNKKFDQALQGNLFARVRTLTHMMKDVMESKNFQERKDEIKNLIDDMKNFIATFLRVLQMENPISVNQELKKDHTLPHLNYFDKILFKIEELIRQCIEGRCNQGLLENREIYFLQEFGPEGLAQDLKDVINDYNNYSNQADARLHILEKLVNIEDRFKSFEQDERKGQFYLGIYQPK